MKTDTKKVVLNEKLEEVLNALGNTPIDESEIAKALDEKPLVKSVVLKMALKPSKLKLKDFKAIELAEFFNAISVRITQTKDEEGNFKTTPNTTNFDLPDFEQVENLSKELGKMYVNRQEQEKLHKQIADGEDVDAKGLKKLVKDFSDILVTLDKLTWEVTGLNKDDLSAWEQNLITEQVYAAVQSVEMTSMGKQP